MSPTTKPVGDSVAKINDEFAVGSDLEFQRKWERFESIAWIILIIFILLSLAGVFGRGPAAQARIKASDGSLEVHYERVQRFGTPSVMTIDFPSSSISGGAFQLWAGDSLVKPLGTRRVIPQPERSVIGAGGILYTFAAGNTPASIEFQTEPSALGTSEVRLQVPGRALVEAKIFVVP